MSENPPSEPYYTVTTKGKVHSNEVFIEKSDEISSDIIIGKILHKYDEIVLNFLDRGYNPRMLNISPARAHLLRFKR